MTTSVLLSVSGVLFFAVCVPVPVVTTADSAQVPLFRSGTPVVALNAAVLMLSVIGTADDAAPLGATSEMVCEALFDFAPQVIVAVTVLMI